MCKAITYVPTWVYDWPKHEIFSRFIVPDQTICIYVCLTFDGHQIQTENGWFP